jgi:hypothetical protein
LQLKIILKQHKTLAILKATRHLSSQLIFIEKISKPNQKSTY